MIWKGCSWTSKVTQNRISTSQISNVEASLLQCVSAKPAISATITSWQANEPNSTMSLFRASPHTPSQSSSCLRQSSKSSQACIMKCLPSRLPTIFVSLGNRVEISGLKWYANWIRRSIIVRSIFPMRKGHRDRSRSPSQGQSRRKLKTWSCKGHRVKLRKQERRTLRLRSNELSNWRNTKTNWKNSTKLLTRCSKRWRASTDLSTKN